MQNSQRTIVRYSISFKQQVVRELEMGSSVSELRRRYGIKGISTIPQWLRKFGKDHLLNKVVRIETMEEKDQIKALQAEIKRLKLALADAVMAKECLEVVIDEANKEYQTDLKKNFGEQGSTDSGKGST